MLKKYLNIILITALLALTLNNSLFRHFHRLPNGTLIEHAHPYSGTESGSKNIPSHQHSSSDILVLDSFFQVFNVIVVATIILACILNPTIFIGFSKKASNFFNDVQFYKSLRAPPVII